MNVAAIIANIVLLVIGILLIVPINRLAQRIYHTKAGGDPEDRFIYGVLVNLIWMGFIVVMVGIWVAISSIFWD